MEWEWKGRGAVRIGKVENSVPSATPFPTFSITVHILAEDDAAPLWWTLIPSEERDRLVLYIFKVT